jgi:tetratricopeptide (TPR) repeat protein
VSVLFSDVEALEKALSAIPESERDRPDRADLLNQLAWMIALHEPERSRRLSDEAREISIRLDYPRGLAFAIRNLGYLDLISRDLHDAVEKTKDALDRFRGLGERAGESSALNSMAIAYSRMGDYGKALETAHESLSISEAIRDRRGEAWAWVEDWIGPPSRRGPSRGP